MLGDSIFDIAIIWYVVELTGSAKAVGSVMIFSTVPYLILQIFGGVVVDRYDRKRIMLSSGILSCATVLVFAALVIADAAMIWHIYILAAFFGLVGAFFIPAHAALLPTIVDKSELVTANSLRTTTSLMCGILGPVIGGTLISLPYVGVGGVSIINAVTFAVGAAGIWFIRLLPEEKTGAVHESYTEALISGFKYLLTRREILFCTAVACLLNLVGVPIIVLMPLFVKEVLSAGAGSLGLIEGGSVIGAITGAIIIGRMGPLQNRGLIIMRISVAQGVLLILLSLSRDVLSVGVLFALFSLLHVVESTVYSSYLQETVPYEFRGRVFSAMTVIGCGLNPIAIGIAGVSADTFGLIPVIVASGIGWLIVATVGLSIKEIRKLN